ncbi:hypothetical protein B0J14DRAFT_578554 [Halenospora varia]|nr:hypothetical protein B0J14DRAFT_578554 [Halenospora varia]
MSSILNTTTTVTSSTPLPSHITKAEVLSFLHNKEGMLALNPLIKSHTLLPPTSSTTFYKSVPTNLKPSSESEIQALPVYAVVEAQASEEQGGETWRGGWAKRFIPEEITYEVSQQNTDVGMFSITHAPMGVHSVTTWTVKDGANGGVELGIKGEVSSNRMLMGFIRTTLQESYDKLAKDFAVAAGEKFKKGGEVEEKGVDKAEGTVESVAVAA